MHVDPIYIPIVAILMPLVLVPTLVILKHRHRRREWEHLERMRALKSHLPMAVNGGWVGSGGVAAIGAGVPIASLLAALLTTYIGRQNMLDEIPMPIVAWGCAVLISAGGLFTSLLLALVQSRTILKLESARKDAADVAKPAFDPDTFDVVGSRG